MKLNMEKRKTERTDVMFRCELRFDEEKVIKDGYYMEAVNELMDYVFCEKKGLKKVAEGIYEDPDATSSKITFDMGFTFWNNPVIVHYCNYLHVIGPEGDYGDCSHMLEKYKSLVPMYDC